jgi:hypothetical protein
MSKGLKYKKVASIESFGNRRLGVQIHIAAGRKMTKDEENLLSEMCEKISEFVSIQSELLDPEVQEDIKREKADLLDCFQQPIYVKEIPEEYGDRPHYPWFEVTTARGPIKIGWRRRVIMIDWSQTNIQSDAKTLFPKEDVTKDEKYIHAWGYGKAKEYINTLMRSV